MTSVPHLVALLRMTATEGGCGMSILRMMVWCGIQGRDTCIDLASADCLKVFSSCSKEGWWLEGFTHG